MYFDALHTRLGAAPRRNAATAGELGRHAIHLGADTLVLARMHEQALAELILARDGSGSHSGLVKKAGGFFTEVLTPIEQVHRDHRNSLGEMKVKAEQLELHASSLIASNRALKREVRRRKAGEAAIKRGKDRYHRLFVESQLMQKKLKRLTRQVLSAQEDERLEISRELHDEVVQTLVGINVELAALGKATSISVKSLRARIAHTQKLVGKSVRAVHQFARELRPAALDDLGLIPALQAYMKTVAKRKRMKILLSAFAEIESLEIARRTVLFRIAQEALTNVRRHAEASLVKVDIRRMPGGVCMEIHDNGKSFDVPNGLDSRNSKRLGLLGMKERVEMMGGTFGVQSSPGHGTTVRAELPFVANPIL
jgi:two-component system, NarL family, sensor histidine kinase DegS